MKLLRLTAIIASSVFLFTSCKKFLDVKPKGYIIAETVGDYESVLNDENIVSPFGLNGSLIYPTDDVVDYSLTPQNQQSVKGNLYFWHQYINGEDESPEVWLRMYNNIANMNLITEGVMDAIDGTEEKKKQLYAEALLNKVFSYYQLLAYFSPAYDKSTAASNYGVPYITVTDVSQPEPARPSLEESYSRMIEDALAALPDLPTTNIDKSRPTKGAAYGMLTRIYISMRDYDNALKYADLALAEGGKILNYNRYIGSSLPSAASSPEELWLRYGYNVSYRYSEDLLSKYDKEKDLRFLLYASLNDDGSYNYGSGNTTNPNRGIGYPEIYLDKAECLARQGNVTEALQIVNKTIRVNRFSPEDYRPLKAATTEEAIEMVLAERRREVAFKGVRWSDMKRLDADGRMPPVLRYANDGTVLETLEPGSTKYTFQIPLSVQAFNPDMPLNKR